MPSNNPPSGSMSSRCDCGPLGRIKEYGECLSRCDCGPLGRIKKYGERLMNVIQHVFDDNVREICCGIFWYLLKTKDAKRYKKISQVTQRYLEVQKNC